MSLKIKELKRISFRFGVWDTIKKEFVHIFNTRKEAEDLLKKLDKKE